MSSVLQKLKNHFQSNCEVPVLSAIITREEFYRLINEMREPDPVTIGDIMRDSVRARFMVLSHDFLQFAQIHNEFIQTPLDASQWALEVVGINEWEVLDSCSDLVMWQKYHRLVNDYKIYKS